MTDSVAVPANITLTVAGAGSFDLQGVQCTFQANGINVALCNLAVGSEAGGGVAVNNIERGAEVTIRVANTFGEEVSTSTATFGSLVKDNKPFKLFEGVVDDWGPTTITPGTFAVQVRCFGRLAWLSSGTLQTNNIIPKSFLDLGVEYPYGQGENDPGMLQLDEALGSNGFWDAVQNMFQRVASTGPTVSDINANSVTKAIFDTFGTSINGEVLPVLQDIRGQLPWKSSVVGAVPGFVYHLNEQLRANWFYGSFFEALVALGEQLMFKVVEHGEGIAVVPFHPFWSRAGTSFRTINANTWDSFEWILDNYESYAGAVLVHGNSTQDLTGQNQGGEELILGLGKVANFGRVHVGPAPGFMAVVSEAMRQAQTDKSRAAGIAPEIRAAFGDDYAKIMALSLNYRSRRCRVSTPSLRTDIGPLSPVAVRFPDIPEITGGAGTSVFGVYGTIEAVTIAMDATKKYASTVYDVGFVRSLAQQSQIIDALNLPHPFFRDNFAGARLDQDPFTPGFTIGV